MRLAHRFFGPASIAAGTRLVCLRSRMKQSRHRRLPHVCVAIASAALYCAGAWGAPPEPADSAQAKAKLAVVRARIAALANRLGDELKQRDALSARLREAELVIAAKRRRGGALRAAQAAADRRRSELRGEQSRDQNALQAERAALAAEVRAAYMIGRQEQLKVLLNQSNPASLGRTLTYYGYLAAERGRKIDAVQGQVIRLQQLVAEIDRQTVQLQTLESDVTHEVAGLEHAHEDRADALAAVVKQVASGNQ